MHGKSRVRTYTISTPFDCVRLRAEETTKGITAEMAIYHLSMKSSPETAATAPLLLLPIVPVH